MTNQPADGDLAIAIEQIRDAIDRTCPPEDSRLADALVNCQIVSDKLAESEAALAAAAEQLREVNEVNETLRQQLSDQAHELGEVSERLAAAERLLDRAWVAKQSFWYHDEVCIHHPFFSSGWMAQKNPLLIGVKGTTGAEALRTCQPHEFNGFGFDNPIDAYLAAVAAGWLPREGE